MCPDASAIQGFLDGALSERERTAIEAHLDECTACRRLVSAVATGNPATAPTVALGPAHDATETAAETERSHPDPLCGVTIDRYQVIDRLGRGGMGVVSSAVGGNDREPIDRRSDGQAGRPRSGSDLEYRQACRSRAQSICHATNKAPNPAATAIARCQTVDHCMTRTGTLSSSSDCVGDSVAFARGGGIGGGRVGARRGGAGVGASVGGGAAAGWLRVISGSIAARSAGAIGRGVHSIGTRDKLLRGRTWGDFATSGAVLERARNGGGGMGGDIALSREHGAGQRRRDSFLPVSSRAPRVRAHSLRI